jgi:hypothetical protein
MMDSVSASCSAHCLSTLFGMFSGHDALAVLIFLSSLATPSSMIFISVIECFDFIYVLGRTFALPLVNTDENTGTYIAWWPYTIYNRKVENSFYTVLFVY